MAALTTRELNRVLLARQGLLARERVPVKAPGASAARPARCASARSRRSRPGRARRSRRRPEGLAALLGAGSVEGV
jgi:hypothetical protein